MANDALQRALAELKARIGEESPPSEWFQVTQEKIDQFAEATMDHQWIHVDAERAKDGPFGKTIAHGHLTLSMMNHLPQPPGAVSRRMDGQKLGINYGFNRVRFPAPVPVGSFIRTRRTLRSVAEKGGMIEAMYEVVVEIKDSAKPACVAESLSRMVF